MKIWVLTSSRAEYGILSSLLRRLKADSFFQLTIVAFGTHLSKKHGYTLNNILEDGFTAQHKLETAPEGDSPSDLTLSMAETTKKFGELWAEHKDEIDLVLCLGDRYEMYAAVAATIPFNLRVAHISGGERTDGAIDNIFRNCLTQIAKVHFTLTEAYADRVKEMIGFSENVFNTGALNLDAILELPLFSIQDFKERFGIDMSIPSILVTFHPETVAYEKNKVYVDELVKALEVLSSSNQIIITMPNADTMGNVIRQKLQEFIGKNLLVKNTNKGVIGIENFGSLGYLSCMKLCNFMLGNTSSGIVEAASFGKYVINLGDRQKGRLSGENVLHCPIESTAILACVERIKSLPPLSTSNIYGDGRTGERMVNILKEL